MSTGNTECKRQTSKAGNQAWHYTEQQDKSGHSGHSGRSGRSGRSGHATLTVGEQHGALPLAETAHT
jgi:hypothetical protein